MSTTEETAPSRAAGLVTVQLGPDLKRAWTDWCAEQGAIPGKALRALVEKALAESPALPSKPSSAKPRIRTTPKPDRAPKVSRELQFTPSENVAIEATASAEGFGFQEWVIAAVRAALTLAPAYGQSALELLTQSNAHLAELAMELASLRRQQSKDKLEDGSVEVAEEPATTDTLEDELTRIEADIRQHVEKVSAVMAQGVQRWQLKL